MRLRPLVFRFASCGVSFAAAQPNPAAKVDERSESLPAVFAPRSGSLPPQPTEATPQASSPSAPRRAISPTMAANLAALAARAPGASVPRTSDTPGASAHDATDVVQLKPYVVEEVRVPHFKAHELLTSKGKLELARKRYPGLGSFGDGASLLRLEQDLHLEYLRDLEDMAALLELDGRKSSLDAKRLINDGKHAERFHEQFGHLPR
jgi:hypothetical protein